MKKLMTKKFFYNKLDKIIESGKLDESAELVLFFDRAPVQTEMTINLSHEGAALHLVCLALAKDAKKIPLHIQVNHLAPKTESTLLFKGVARDQSELTTNVKVKIAKGARQSKTRVEMRMLLASPTARAKPVPALEIEENEVQASHAASVGRLEEEALFYLMSRGLSEEQAKKLLVDGFIQDVFDKIESPLLKEKLRLCLPK